MFNSESFQLLPLEKMILRETDSALQYGQIFRKLFEEEDQSHRMCYQCHDSKHNHILSTYQIRPHLFLLKNSSSLYRCGNLMHQGFYATKSMFEIKLSRGLRFCIENPRQTVNQYQFEDKMRPIEDHIKQINFDKTKIRHLTQRLEKNIFSCHGMEVKS